jgi:hypothetical protein
MSRVFVHVRDHHALPAHVRVSAHPSTGFRRDAQTGGSAVERSKREVLTLG